MSHQTGLTSSPISGKRALGQSHWVKPLPSWLVTHPSRLALPTQDGRRGKAPTCSSSERAGKTWVRRAMPDFSWGPGSDYPGGGSPSSSSDNPRKLSLGCHPDNHGIGGRSAEGKAPFSAFCSSPTPLYGWRRGAPPPMLYSYFVNLAVDRRGCLANTLTLTLDSTQSGPLLDPASQK